jgi:hypothetical protein
VPPTLLRVRLLQLWRELQQLGWRHKILFAFLFIGLLVVCSQTYQNPKLYWAVPAVLITISAFAQISRPDRNFIFLHLAKPRLVILTEYMGLAIPFIIPAFFSPFWYCIFVLPPGFYGITFLKVNFKFKTRFTFLGKFLPFSAFEWIAGFRETLPGFVLLYAAALALCWVKGLPIILLWICGFLIVSFYQHCEPVAMLRAYEISSRNFLRRKIKSHCCLFVSLSLPVLVLQSLFHPIMALAGLLFLVLQVCVLSFTILLKYSTYEPETTRSSNMLLISFAQLSILLPFFLLLPIALLARNYRLAKQNSTYYLPCWK